jgi:hypothetical protein
MLLTMESAVPAVLSLIKPAASLAFSGQPKTNCLPLCDLPVSAVRSVTQQDTWSGIGPAMDVPGWDALVLRISGLSGERRSITPTPVNEKVAARNCIEPPAVFDVLNEEKIVSAMLGLSGPAVVYWACCT